MMASFSVLDRVAEKVERALPVNPSPPQPVQRQQEGSDVQRWTGAFGGQARPYFELQMLN
jgi:hypothetical protein